MPMNLVYSEDRQYNAGRHMMDEEIRHFLDTGETPNGASAKPKTDAEKLYELGKENEFLSKLVQLHGVHNEIRETAAEIDAERAERRKTVQLPPEIHQKLGMFAAVKSTELGRRVSLAEAVELALEQAPLSTVDQRSIAKKARMLAEIGTTLESEFPGDDWTNMDASGEASIYIQGKLVSLFEMDWIAVRATRPSTRADDANMPVPITEAKLVVVKRRTGDVMHREVSYHA